MSRTDKDTPWWVLAEWWEPDHLLTCPNSRPRRWVKPTRTRDHVCDLPPVPVVRYPVRFTRFNLHLSGCQWQPVWLRHLCYGQGAPPQWFINHVGNAPTRRQVREDCQRAIQEYRATGDVDVMPPTDQHRHGAGWRYW